MLINCINKGINFTFWPLKSYFSMKFINNEWIILNNKQLISFKIENNCSETSHFINLLKLIDRKYAK